MQVSGLFSSDRSDDISSYESCSQTSSVGSNSEDIKEQLPTYVFSKAGILSSQHLFYYLNKENPTNFDKIILWSFSQRKFTSLIQARDTIYYNPGSTKILNSQGCYGQPTMYIDHEGLATSISKHPVDFSIFLSDQQIIKIDECEWYELKYNNKVYVGYYPDGRCMIQQPTICSSLLTALAMALIDNKVDFDLGVLFKKPLGTNLQTKYCSEQYGYEMISLDSTVDIIKNWNENGALLASVTAQDIGSNHWIVIDSINYQEVTIRDPAHGWRVTFATYLLFTMHPSFKGIKKMET